MSPERERRDAGLALSAAPLPANAELSRQLLVGAAAGALFAVGLALSGMTNPGRVLAFLDVAGAWDPRLLLVMGGAVGVHFTYLRLSLRAAAPADAVGIDRSSRAPAPLREAVSRVDQSLVVGAALFGVGWGMSGYCPGPALSALAFGRAEALVFMPGLLLGIALCRLLRRT